MLFQVPVSFSVVFFYVLFELLVQLKQLSMI